MNTRELGRWRKLWTRPSPQWEMLPALARGLGDEMIRYCDEQGRFPLGGLDPLTVVCRMLRAHPSERRSVKASLDTLIADGFATVIGDALVVRNFVTAQGAITDSGERMRTMRERAVTQPADNRGTTGGLPAESCGTTGGQRPNDASTRNHSEQVRHSDSVRVEESRVEERREEKTKKEEHRHVETDGSDGSVVNQVFDHWRTKLNHPVAKLDSKRRAVIARALKSHGLATTLAAIDGCAASEFHMGANDRNRRFDDLTLILRDASKIESFASPPIAGAQTGRSGQASAKMDYQGRKVVGVAAMPTTSDWEADVDFDAELDRRRALYATGPTK